MFTVDRSGRTVGRRPVGRRPRGRRGTGPRAARPGLGRRHRRQHRHPGHGLGHLGAGRARTRPSGDVRTYELDYPGGSADAEALLADPRTGRLVVVTKGLVGGQVLVAPRELRRRPGQPAAAARRHPGAGHRRRVPPRRAPRGAPRLHAGGRLHLPRARGGRRGAAAPAAAGRGHRRLRRRPAACQLGGAARARVRRRPAGAGGAGGRRTGRPVREPARRRPPPRSPPPVPAPDPAPVRREPWPWLVGRLGRPWPAPRGGRLRAGACGRLRRGAASREPREEAWRSRSPGATSPSRRSTPSSTPPTGRCAAAVASTGRSTAPAGPRCSPTASGGSPTGSRPGTPGGPPPGRCPRGG